MKIEWLFSSINKMISKKFFKNDKIMHIITKPIVYLPHKMLVCDVKICYDWGN